MRKIPLVLAAVGLTLALALAGCSSKSSKAKVDSSSSTPPVSLSGALTDKGTKDATGDGATPTLALEADDNFFTPTFTQFVPGAVVTVQLKNGGTHEHTFTLADGTVDQSLSPGQTAEVKVTIPASGTASFFCKIHRSSGMQGAFYTSASASGSGSGSGAGSSTSTTTTAGSSSTTASRYGGY
ncbi:MAG: cupredoxin domain-containing protein [Acidimicrobiales bacterium]